VDSASQSTILEKNKQIVRDFAEDVFNRHDLAAIDKYMTGGCVGISTKDYGPSACPLRTNSSIVSSSIRWRTSPTVSHGPVLMCQAADDLTSTPVKLGKTSHRIG
jgi:hypothetical protein